MQRLRAFRAIVMTIMTAGRPAKKSSRALAEKPGPAALEAIIRETREVRVARGTAMGRTRTGVPGAQAQGINGGMLIFNDCVLRNTCQVPFVALRPAA